VKAEDIVARIRAVIPDALVEMKDLTGTSDHWQASIVSTAFAGKSLIQRHRLVMAALAEEMKGPIHALTLEVKTPDEASQGGTSRNES
jgi:stress-induced morphogen